MDTVSPKEISDLRAIFAAIKEGESSWSDYTNGEETPKITKPAISKKPKDQPPIETTTTPVAAEPVKEQNTPVSSRDSLISIAENNGISFAAFHQWFGNKYGKNAETDKWTDWDSVSEDAAIVVMSNPKTLSNMKLILSSK